MKLPRTILLTFVCLLAAGCDRLGIPDPAQTAAQAEAEGKAIGGACRHAGRALEDCYQYNPTASKAAIFAGWREMNDYMTENKIEVVPPQLPPALPGAKKRAKPKADADAAAAETRPDAAADDSADEDAQDRKTTGGKDETTDGNAAEKTRRRKI